VSRTLAQQTVAELGGAGSVLARQRRDHVELDALLRRLEDTAGAEQDEVLTDVCRLVFSHAFAEEAVLWPAVRVALPDGEALTLRVEKEHQEINELVRRLDGSRHTDPGPVGQVAFRLSAGLLAVSDVVERLAPLRRGEDAGTRTGRTT